MDRREVLLFLLLRILQMPFATADEHVWELYAQLDCQVQVAQVADAG